MEQEKQERFVCKGDCMTCRKNAIENRSQWQYCSAQFTLDTMRMVQSMQKALESMNGTIMELSAKITAIQDSEANVLDPSAEAEAQPLEGEGVAAEPQPTEKKTAQEGDGVIE